VENTFLHSDLDSCLLETLGHTKNLEITSQTTSLQSPELISAISYFIADENCTKTNYLTQTQVY
jgi:hypothetical protein